MLSDSSSFNEMMLQASLSHPNDMKVLLSATCENNFSYLAWISFLTAFVMVESQVVEEQTKIPETEEQDKIESHPLIIEYRKSFEDQRSSQLSRSRHTDVTCSSESSSSSACTSSYESENDVYSIDEDKAEFKKHQQDTRFSKKSTSHHSHSHSSKNKRKIKQLKADLHFLEKYNEQLLSQNQELENQLMMSSIMLADMRSENDDKYFELEQERRSLTQMLISLKEEVAHMKEIEDNSMYNVELAHQKRCYMRDFGSIEKPSKIECSTPAA